MGSLGSVLEKTLDIALVFGIGVCLRPAYVPAVISSFSFIIANSIYFIIAFGISDGFFFFFFLRDWLFVWCPGLLTPTQTGPLA